MNAAQDLHRWGEAASLGAALSWAIALCTYRRWGYGISPWGLNLSKNIVGLVGLSLLLLILRPPLDAGPLVYLSLFVSGLAGIALGDTAAYSVLRHLGAPAAAAGVCLGPPLSAILAFLFLGETLSARELLGIVLTVVGVSGSLFCTPKAGIRRDDTFVPSKSWGIFWLSLSGLGHAVGVVLSRYGMPKVDALWGTGIRLVPAQLFLIVLCWYRPSGVAGLWKNKRRLGILSAAATIGTFLGLILMSLGLKYSKAGVSTALMSTYPLWVVPIAHYFLGERIKKGIFFFTVIACVGCAVIVLG